MKTVLAALTVTAILTHAPATFAQNGRLPSVERQSAAGKCQKLIATVTTKVLLGKLKVLDVCGNAALACVQTKTAKTNCLSKAGQACSAKLGAFGKVVDKARAKIAGDKTCARALSLQDLLGEDGLGLESLSEPCATDFQLNVCTDFGQLAECLARVPDRAAGVLYGAARPRMSELLGRLPNGVPPVAGLAISQNCGNNCPLTPGTPKAVEECGKAVTKAMSGLVKTLHGAFAGCAASAFTCLQTQPSNPACSGKSEAACTKGAGNVAKAFARFAPLIDKKCGAAIVDPQQLMGSSGLGWESLGGTCEATPTDAATLASCLRDRAACSVSDLVGRVVGRTGDLEEQQRLGTLAGVLGAACSRERSPAIGKRAFALGSILRFVKQVKRPKVGVFGIVTKIGKPASTPGATGGIVKVGGPTRIKFGAVTKVPFTYRVGGRRGRAAQGAAADEPPALIVTIQRADVTVTDHFEVPLELPPDDGSEIEVDDEIEISYQPALPACSFTLSFATRFGDEVSTYASVPQTVDAMVWGEDISNGPEGGAVASLAIDPKTPGTIFAGTSWGGIFKSIDGGGRWHRLTEGLSPYVREVEAVAIDPVRPSTLFLSGSFINVFKSTDGGASWGQAGTELASKPVSALAIDPKATDTIYAGTDSHGVHKSEDGGASWQAVNDGLTATRITELVIDPKTPKTVYAGTATGLFKTTDGGGSWRSASTGLEGTYIYAIAIDPKTPKNLFAGTLSSGARLFRSTDGGESWTRADQGITRLVVSLAVDPATPSTIYAGLAGDGLAKSTDGGLHWKAIGSELTAVSTEALAIDPADPETLYAGTDGVDSGEGVFKSVDGGASWTLMNGGLVASIVHDIVALPGAPGAVLAAGSSPGLFRSDDRGGSWTPVDAGGRFSAGYAFAIPPGSSSTIYLGGTGVRKSIDGGESWNVSEASPTSLVLSMVIDPVTPTTLYAGTYGEGVFRTIDGSAHWTAMNVGIETASVDQLVIDPTNPTTLYAGTFDDGVFRSTGGGPWEPINEGLPYLQIVALAGDSTGSALYASTFSGLFKRTSAGALWVPIDTLVTSVTAITVDPDDDDILYAGSSDIFKSVDAGAHWELVASRPGIYTQSITFDPTTPGRLYLGTFGNGVVTVE